MLYKSYILIPRVQFHHSQLQDVQEVGQLLHAICRNYSTKILLKP
ncbi:hypothetical protein M6B38_405735 [Iris pallida]|uniref:Uncharacterized protein n=1 Tax=Iris pallida TaxID=29817 RepID=A0AAX6FPQ8_IRIPA|nr:hypothetical protein M6B38_405735 [Iris pallida]